MLKKYLGLIEEEAVANKKVKEAVKALDAKVAAKYAKLSKEEVKSLVVYDKWMGALAAMVRAELDRVSQALAGRIKELVDRYAEPMPEIESMVENLSTKVDGHLKTMGFIWQ